MHIEKMAPNPGDFLCSGKILACLNRSCNRDNLTEMLTLFVMRLLVKRWGGSVGVRGCCVLQYLLYGDIYIYANINI